MCNKIGTDFVTPEKQKPIKTMPWNGSASKIFRGAGYGEISITEIFLLSEQGQQEWRSKDYQSNEKAKPTIEEKSLLPLDQMS